MAALTESVGLNQLSFAGLPLPVTVRLEKRMTDDELTAFSDRIGPYQVERNASGELEIMSPNGLKGASFEAYAMCAAETGPRRMAEPSSLLREAYARR